MWISWQIDPNIESAYSVRIIDNGVICYRPWIDIPEGRAGAFYANTVSASDHP